MWIFMITMLTILVFLCVIANWGHASPHSQKRASDRAQASLRRRRHGETNFADLLKTYDVDAPSVPADNGSETGRSAPSREAGE
jgi:hypothetical protein